MRYAVKLGNNGINVKDIPYIVKEKAVNHYIWLTATSREANKMSIATAVTRTPLGDLGLLLRWIDRLITIQSIQFCGC